MMSSSISLCFSHASRSSSCITSTLIFLAGMVIHIYQTSSLNSQYIPYYQDWRLLKDLRPAGGEAAKDLAVAFVKGNQTVWKDALDLSEVSHRVWLHLHAHVAP